MEETCSKLNSTQKIVVKLLQRLVTECTDRVPATQPCTAYPTQTVTEPACQFFAGYRELLVTVNYRVWRPDTGQSCLR